jgi:hypothetical protein
MVSSVRRLTKSSLIELLPKCRVGAVRESIKTVQSAAKSAQGLTYVKLDHVTYVFVSDAAQIPTSGLVQSRHARRAHAAQVQLYAPVLTAV